MIPTQITDHRSEAVELLTDKWRTKPVTSGFLKAIVKPFDALETAIFDTINGRPLGSATGVWLDYQGALVGETRKGRSDTDYEVAIRLRVRVNRSNGLTVDVIDVASLFGNPATYQEYFPKAWEVSIYNTASQIEIATMLGKVRGLGTYGVFVSSTWSESNVFKFSNAGESSPSNVFGSAQPGGPDRRFPAAFIT